MPGFWMTRRAGEAERVIRAGPAGLAGLAARVQLPAPEPGPAGPWWESSYQDQTAAAAQAAETVAAAMSW